MTKLIAVFAFALFATTVYATCTSWYQTTSDGRTVFCTRCCQGGSCSTTCN